MPRESLAANKPVKKKPATSPRKTPRRAVPTRKAPPDGERILATTDFSAQALPAVRYAMALGGKLGASVTLVHVVEPAAPLARMDSVVLARPDSEIAAMARLRLEEMARQEGQAVPRASSVVRTGTPFHEIVLIAEEREVDLIVIGTHGRTGLKRVWLGSTAERVVRHATCPVLTVPTREHARRSSRPALFRIAKILVPIDFSAISVDALPYASRLAVEFGASIVLLHVVKRFPIEGLLGAELVGQILVPTMLQAESDLERIAADLRQATGAKVSAVVRAGTPHEVICRVAKSSGADLVVLTTHGYTGLKHVWMGSTAERVVRHASCPVLAVRELAWRNP